MKHALIALMLFVSANTLHTSDRPKAVLHTKKITLEVPHQLKSAAAQHKKTGHTLRKSYAAAAAAQTNKPQSRKPAATQTKVSPLDLTVIGAAIKARTQPSPATADTNKSDGDDDCPSDGELDDSNSDLCMTPEELASCGYRQAPVFFDNEPLNLKV